MRVHDFTDDPEAVEAQRIAREMQLAQLLTQQAMSQQPIYSNKAGIARALMGALGGYQRSQAEEKQRALAERRQAAEKGELEQILGASEKGDALGLARLLIASSRPELRQMGLVTALKAKEPKEEEFGTDPKEGLGPDGKPVLFVAGKRGGTKTLPFVPNQKPQGPKVGEVRRITRGGEEVSEEYTAEGWKEIGRGPRWQPQQEDRSLVEVADPNRPGATIMVPRAQAIGKPGAASITAERSAREDADALRKEFAAMPEVKNFRSVLPIVQSASRAPDTPAGDIDLIYAVGKVMDPDSVVREGEMNLVIKSGSPVQRFQGWANNIMGGGRLTPQQRTELMSVLNSRVSALEKGYSTQRQVFEGIASRRGYSAKELFGDAPKATDTGTAGPKRISSEAEYKALRPGETYIAPDGSVRTKR